MTTIDDLPIDLLILIASTERIYGALITAYPRFARAIPAVPREGYIDRFDMMVKFGYDVRVTRINKTVYEHITASYIAWTRNGVKHLCRQPAMLYDDGTIAYYRHGNLHSYDDEPAIIRPSGDRKWYQHGKLHRDGGPAWVTANGDQYWYDHGDRHRSDDLPAVVKASGNLEWWDLGQLHRNNDQPAKICADGRREWWCKGCKHRTKDQPAVIREDGTREWWQHNSLHRQGKPAVIGAYIDEWYTRGDKIKRK